MRRYSCRSATARASRHRAIQRSCEKIDRRRMVSGGCRSVAGIGFPGNSLKTRQLSRPAGLSTCPPAREGNGHTTVDSPHSRNIRRQDYQAKRDHPEAEQWQKAEQTEENERDADSDPRQAIAGKIVCLRSEAYFCQSEYSKTDCGRRATEMWARLRVSARHHSIELTVIPPLCSAVWLCYSGAAMQRAPFPGSSVVEQPAVNRLVAGSNPARGAICTDWRRFIASGAPGAQWRAQSFGDRSAHWRRAAHQSVELSQNRRILAPSPWSLSVEANSEFIRQQEVTGVTHRK